MKPDLDIRRACKLLHEYNYADEAVLLEKAPEMARMLLKLEWVGDGGGTPVCGECNVARYGPTTDENPHRDGCAWLALMTAIGATPPGGLT